MARVKKRELRKSLNASEVKCLKIWLEALFNSTRAAYEVLPASAHAWNDPMKSHILRILEDLHEIRKIIEE